MHLHVYYLCAIILKKKLWANFFIHESKIRLIFDKNSCDPKRHNLTEVLTYLKKYFIALMDVPEIAETFPWLMVSSSSDSESDTGGEADNQIEERKLRQKWGCIRQAALLTLKIVVKNTGKRHLCQYWTSFLPSCTKLASEVDENELDQSN